MAINKNGLTIAELQELVDALVDVLGRADSGEFENGICYEVEQAVGDYSDDKSMSTLEQDDYLAETMRDWPLSSGSKAYPIPWKGPANWATGKLRWQGEQLEYRKSLLVFCIDTIKEEICQSE